MSIKHYFNPMSRAVTTDWMLRELDVPHKQVIIDTSAGEQNTPEYRAINLMGKLPALVDGQTIVTETAAICAYLADKFAEKHFAPDINSPERTAYYRYLFIPGNTFEPAFSVAAAGFEHPQPQSAGWGDRERVMETIKSMCPNDGWALGGEFSTADVVFGGILDFSMVLIGLRHHPKLQVTWSEFGFAPLTKRPILGLLV